MTTRSNILLTFPFQQFNPASHLSCSLASSLTHSTGTTAAEALLPMPTDDDAPSHIANVPEIPSSVKGAPSHLRPVIRKRQNSESAKRSRQRRKEAARRFYQRFDQQCQRISSLEKRVAQLTDLVKQRQKMADEESDSLAEEQQETHTPTQQEKPIFSTSNEKPGHIGAMDIIEQPVQAPHPPDLSGDGAISFEQDLEALLDSCIPIQYGIDESFCLDAPFY